MPEEEIEKLIAELENQGYLDAARFANAYCHDKFEFNSWGRLKIRSMIQEHRIEKELVEKALERIDEQAYFERLLKLARKKWEATKSEELSSRKKKVMAFLMSRGYEIDLGWDAINVLSKEE